MITAVRSLLLLFAFACTANAADAVRDRSQTDEIIYFVLPDRFENGNLANDRGGLPGDRLQHGFDPTSKAFFHGGDLQGLTARLDYIQALGATAVWLTPVFKNKAVQGAPGQESAGYHGYWITDFTAIDPHLGDEAQMQAFVRAAHARGMKVYLDIIANHTADVIAYANVRPSNARIARVPNIPIRAAAACRVHRSTQASPATTSRSSRVPISHIPPTCRRAKSGSRCRSG